MPYTAWVTLCTLSLSLSLLSTVCTDCRMYIFVRVYAELYEIVCKACDARKRVKVRERDCWERGWFKWVNTSPRRSCQNLLGHWNDGDDPVLLSSGFILVWCMKNRSVLRRAALMRRVSGVARLPWYKGIVEIEDDGPCASQSSLNKWIDENRGGKKGVFERFEKYKKSKRGFCYRFALF